MYHCIILWLQICSSAAALAPEHAELLINYVPTDEESVALNKHGHHKERFAEAERFMFEMLKVERYDSRCAFHGYVCTSTVRMCAQVPTVVYYFYFIIIIIVMYV